MDYMHGKKVMQSKVYNNILNYNLYCTLEKKYGKINSVIRQNNALTNHVFKIQTSSKSFILKLFKHKFNNIDDIIKINKYMFQQKVSPQILEVNKAKYLIIDYLHNEDESINNVLPSFKQAINMLHNAKLNVNSRNYDKLIAYYINNLSNHDPKMADKLSNYTKTCLKNIDKFPTQLGLCHNDIHRDNLIFNQQKCYLIDFEYASINDIYVDLANIKNLLDEDSFKSFIQDYENQNKISFDLDKLLHYTNMISLITILWSYYMLNNNSTGIINLDCNTSMAYLPKNTANYQHCIYCNQNGCNHIMYQQLISSHLCLLGISA